MQGLQLSRDYFLTFGFPMIMNEFLDICDRIAVGLVGPGSECYGFDDELSRDHDWGPGFCIWLNSSDFASRGNDLNVAYHKLPASFSGFGPRLITPGEEIRWGVMIIDRFYNRYTGLPHPPTVLSEWVQMSEQSLGVCTNGMVFFDPSDQFSSWRRLLLEFYPEDIRRLKISSRCMRIGQSGQYNLTRCLQRNDLFSSRYAELQFCHELMSLAFLLNKKYPPYYKWLHRATLDLPILGKILFENINALLASSDGMEKIVVIEKLCSLVIDELHRQDLSDSNSQFMLDHASVVYAGIRDPGIRNKFNFLPKGMSES
jgi:hypothetical protein